MISSDGSAPAPPRSYSTRRWRLCRADEALVCPNGHRFHDPLVWHHGGLRCTHRTARGGEDCGATVLLLAGGFADLQGRPVTLLVEVTSRELHAMRLARMDVAQMLDYLGL